MGPRRTSSRLHGFTLVEVVFCVCVFAAVSIGITYLAATMVAEGSKKTISVGGTTYALAPDINELHSAIQAHQLFTELRFAADAVLVFGGIGSHPTLDPIGPSSVLSWDSKPTTLDGMVGADPFRQFSSWEQRTVNAGSLSFVTAGSSADFTVLFVQGLTRVIGNAEQRRFETTVNGQSFVCYDVVIERYTYTGSTVTGTLTYAYHIFYRAHEDSWRSPPGARHVWSRIDTTWDRTEEAGAFLVFADPYITAGENLAADLRPISQFSYFVPVTN